MSSVDDRIVNMKFNNSQFGQGVDKTKRDLTGLEQTITNAGKSKGMAQLGASADGMKMKFSALQVAGVAAFGTIVSKATSAGLRMLKSFTIQPIIDGFKEYQTGLQSVQTIMANTGRPVKEVNSALDQLNTYADKTIYNFGEMAKNVGTFTAAGVDLKTSVASIKGIANLAAMSGSTSQQASTAMYQLSQSIAAGKVGLQDWNSVVNAGMGGKIFQTALARTAINMGELNKGAMKLVGPMKKLEINGSSFRNSISAAPGQTAWLTGDAMVETLKQISGGYTVAELRADGFSKKSALQIDKLAKDAFNAATQIKTLPQLLGVIKESIGSTFAGAFRIIMGDFTQSKKLWGDVGYSIIGPHGWLTRIQDGFTHTLQKWADRGGRTKVLKGFGDLFKGLGRVVGAFRDAFTDIFPPATGKNLIRITKDFRQFAKNLVPSKDTLESLGNIFRGFFSVLHVGWAIVKGVFGAFTSFFGALFNGSDMARGGILSLLGSIGQVLTGFDAWLTKGGRLTDFLSGLGNIAGAFLAPVAAAIGLVVKGFAILASGGGIGGAMMAFTSAKSIFGDFVSNIVSGLDRITAPFDGLKSKIADFAMQAIAPFQGFIDALKALGADISGDLGLDKLSFSLAGLQSAFDNAKSYVVDFANSFSITNLPLENVGSAIDYVVDKVKILVSSLDISSKVDAIKSSISSLFDSFSSGGSSAASAGGSAMAASADATSGAFSKLGGVLSGIWAVMKTVVSYLGQAAGAIGGFLKDLFPSDALEWASALNVLLSGAIIKKLFFSKGVFESLGDAIEQFGEVVGGSISSSFDQLTSTLKTMQNNVKSEIIKNIAIAVALLTASIIALSFVPAEKIGIGLASLGAAFGMLSLMLLAIAKIDAKMKVSVIASALIMMSTAILILTGAIAALGYLPWDVLKQGMEGVAVVMGLMTLSFLALGKVGAGVLAAGGAMIFMSIAITSMTAAIAILGKLPLEVVQQGLKAVAYGIGIMTLSLLMLAGAGPAVLAAGGAMIMMSIAMDVLVGAITVLGLLPWAAVDQGLKAVAYGLGIMTLSLLLLSGAGPAVLAAGGAMLMMAVSMNILMGVILLLGKAPWSVVEQGLMAMAIALGILLGAAAIAMAVLPGLAALQGVILAIGAALLMAGAGFALFATGLALFVAVGVAAIGIMTLAIHAFIALLPTIALQMAAAFVTFIQAIALAAPKIRKAFGIIFKNMLGTIRDALPEIGKLMNALIDLGIGVIEHSIPRWVEMGFTIIDKFLKSANDHIPSIVKSATNLAMFFIEEMGNNAVKFANAGADVLIKTLNGLSDAIENKGDEIRAAAGRLARTFVDELRESLVDLVTSIHLPDIPMPHIPEGLKKLGAGIGLGRSMVSPNGRPSLNVGRKPTAPKAPIDSLAESLKQTAKVVSTAIEAAVRLFVGAIDGVNYNFAKAASDLRRSAERSSTIADIRGTTSQNALSGADEAMQAAEGKRDKARRIKDKGKRAKALKKAKRAISSATRLRKDAQKQVADAERQAQKAQMDRIAADFATEKARDAVTYKDDLAGLGSSKQRQGDDLSERSADLLASAQAKADEIKRLEKMAAKGGHNAKKYRDQAKQLRKEAVNETAQAMLLANQALEAQTEAVAAFAAARKETALDVLTSMNEIRKKREDDQAAKEWDARFAVADTETKIAMLEARALAKEQERDKAQAALAAAYAESDALAAQIDSGEVVTEAQLAAIQLALENAQKNADVASKAADDAGADRDQIKQLKGQVDGGSNLSPNRSALEDAARAVDRYTASVAQAEEMAMAGASTTQFVQNNYSPEALSASEIYRRTNNLISNAEVKMGGNH